MIRSSSHARELAQRTSDIPPTLEVFADGVIQAAFSRNAVTVHTARHQTFLTFRVQEGETIDEHINRAADFVDQASLVRPQQRQARGAKRPFDLRPHLVETIIQFAPTQAPVDHHPGQKPPPLQIFHTHDHTAGCHYLTEVAANDRTKPDDRRIVNSTTIVPIYRIPKPEHLANILKVNFNMAVEQLTQDIM